MSKFGRILYNVVLPTIIVTCVVVAFVLALDLLIGSAKSQSLESDLVDRLESIKMEYDVTGHTGPVEILNGIIKDAATVRDHEGTLLADLEAVADDFREIGRADIADRIMVVVEAWRGVPHDPPPDPDCSDPQHAEHEHCQNADPPPIEPPVELKAVISGAQIAGILQSIERQGYLPIPLRVSFSCRTSIGPIRSCSWNWGDGWPATTGGWLGEDLARHTYQTEAWPTPFTLTLTVVDADGNTANDTLELPLICVYGACNEPGYVFPEPP